MKKWLLFSLVFIIVVSGASAGCKSEEEKAAEELFPKMEEMGSVPDLKYIEPPGVAGRLEVAAQVNKEHWERLGTLSIEVKVKNISNQTLLRAIVIRTLFDKSGSVMGTRDAYGVGSEITRLNPGEVTTADLSMLVVSNAEKVSLVEYSLKDIIFAEESASAPSEKPESNEPEKTEGVSVNSAFEYSESPETPEEIVRAFYGLTFDGKYSEAEKLCTQHALRGFQDDGGLERCFKRNLIPEFKGRQVIDIKVKLDIEGDRARTTDFIEWYFDDGTTESFCTLHLVKVDGEWKVD